MGADTGLLCASLAAGMTYVVFDGCFWVCGPSATDVFGVLMLGITTLIGAAVAILARIAATGTRRLRRRAALVGMLAAFVWLAIDGQLRRSLGVRTRVRRGS